MENKLGGNIAQQRQSENTRDRSTAAWLMEVLQKIDGEAQGYRKGKLQKQGP